MKTPKRYIEIAPFEFDTTEKEHQILPEHILEQRFKRKNRIAQLKRTIARQAEEIYHLRKLVELKLATEYAESEKQALRWALENIVIRTFAPNLTCEEIDGKLMLCNVAPRPQITFK